MRILAFTLLLALPSLAGTGCISCWISGPEDVDLSRPERTLTSFQRAFTCDRPVLEYRCLTDEVKTSFGSYAGYKIGRDILRDENSLAVLLFGAADLEERTEIALWKDGNRATARIDLGDDTVEVLLFNQPLYRLFHEDGSVTEGFASELVADLPFPGILRILLRDKWLAEEPTAPFSRVEVETRWVIAAIPGLDSAIETAKKTSNPSP